MSRTWTKNRISSPEDEIDICRQIRNFNLERRGNASYGLGLNAASEVKDEIALDRFRKFALGLQSTIDNYINETWPEG